MPPVETIDDTPQEIREKQQRVRELCAERNAVLLAHHYQRPEVQEVADAVADSLKLSQTGRKDRRGRHRFLRRAFHGRNRGDSVPGENGAAAGPARGLLAGGVRHAPKSFASGRRSCPMRWWSPTSTLPRR